VRSKKGSSRLLNLSLKPNRRSRSAQPSTTIEAVVLLSARTHADGGKTLRSAAQVYGVDPDAVALKVKQEFTAKKARKATKPESKPVAKAKRAA
jgi:ParB family chromosome partitioning protein